MLHGGNHTGRDHPFIYSASHKDTAVGTKNLEFGHIRTKDFHRSNVHCSCFLAQESFFLLLVYFSSGIFAAVRPWRPVSRSLLWTVNVEMCLFLELCETFIWAIISEAGNSNERILCSRGNSGSSFPVAVFMRASFIIAIDGFCDVACRNFQVSYSCRNIDLVFHQTGLSSVYHPYLVTTQLIGSNAFRRKEIPQITF